MTYLRKMAQQYHLWLVSGAYALIAYLILAPMFPLFSSAIIGGPVATVDGWQNVWNMWWMREAVTYGRNLFFTRFLYYPQGVDMSIQTLSPSNGVLGLPMAALFGPVAGYNTALLLAVVLSGLAAYGLALAVTQNHAAAFIGGVIVTFGPFHMTKIWDGQLELMAMQWLILYMVLLLLSIERPRWYYVLLAGAALALVGYTSWYYLFFAAVYSVAAGLLWWPHTRDWRSHLRYATRLSLIAAVGVVLLLPMLQPALAAVGTAPKQIDTTNPFDSVLMRSANLLDLLLPSYLHPLWGGAIWQLGQTWHPYVAGWNMALGYTALLLALIGGVIAGRTHWRWWVLAALGVVLSLGPVLRIGTLDTGIPMPFTLLLNLPGGNVMHRASHFAVITVIMLAPLSAIGAKYLFERSAKLWPLTMLLLMALLAFEFMPPAWQIYESEAHPYYSSLVGSIGAVMDIPPVQESSESLIAQLLHQRPLVGGDVARDPDFVFAEQAPGVRQLWSMRPTTDRMLPMSGETALDLLRYYRIRHIIVHPERLDPQNAANFAAALAQALPGKTPQYADSDIQAYFVEGEPAAPFAYFWDGWYPEEQDGARSWRWMHQRGDVVLVNPKQFPRCATVRLQTESYAQEREVEIYLGSTKLMTWRVPASPQAATLNLDLLIPQGEHRLSFRTTTTTEAGVGRELSIVLTHISVHWNQSSR